MKKITIKHFSQFSEKQPKISGLEKPLFSRLLHGTPLITSHTTYTTLIVNNISSPSETNNKNKEGTLFKILDHEGILSDKINVILIIDISF